MSVPRIECPACKRELWDDDAPFTPEVGLVTVCLYCAQLLEWTSPTQARPIEAASIADYQLRTTMTVARYISQRVCMNCLRPIAACKKAGECKR